MAVNEAAGIDKSVTLIRITLVGLSGCGKTGLVNAFVNGDIHERYTRTDNVDVYYKKLDVKDEGDYGGQKKPLLLEIEDTPGSERDAKGNVEEDDDAKHDESGQAIKVGSTVVVKPKTQEAFIIKMGGAVKDKIPGLRFNKDQHGKMIGRTYEVKAKHRNGSFGLPGPDGTLVYFPEDAIEQKVTMLMPIDDYMAEGLHEFSKETLKYLQKYHAADIQRPFAVYDRNPKAPHEDKTLAKCRMGFMICFNLADPTHASLKEAMHVYEFLDGILRNPMTGTRMRPKIMFVGCQKDRTSPDGYMENNESSAQKYCLLNKENLGRFMTTSAKTHENVEETFHEMIQAILAEENLYMMQGPDDDSGDKAEEEQATCAVQ